MACGATARHRHPAVCYRCRWYSVSPDMVAEHLPEPTRIVLDNGLRLIVAEDHSAPVAAVGFWVDAGVCDEPEDRRGIAHFVEHMMFRGSRHFESQEHARRIARLGGDCNAFTSADTTVFHERVPVEALDQVFELEADRFRHLALTAENLDTERKVILEELHVYENQPATRAMLEIQKQIMAGHPYALSPLGRREDLEALTVDDLRSFCARCYRPTRVVAVVCGDVDTAQVRQLAERTFGDWHSGAEPAPLSSPPPFTPRTGSLAVRLPFEVPLVAQVHRIGPLREINKAALDLLVAMLSSGASSPIREALVHRKRLCVEASCSQMTGSRGGLLIFVGVFMPPGRHSPRRTVMKTVLDDLVRKGPDQDGFERQLKRFRMDRAGDAYVHEDRVLGLGNAEMLEGDFMKYHRELEELSQVTPQAVQQLATTLFAPTNTLELDVTPDQSQWWMVPLGLLMRIMAR